MGRRATGINLLAFSFAMLSQTSYRGNLAHWAKCLQLCVTPGGLRMYLLLNGLFKLGLPCCSIKTKFEQSTIRKIASWFQEAPWTTMTRANSEDYLELQKSDGMI